MKSLTLDRIGEKPTFDGFWNWNLQRRLLKEVEPVMDAYGYLWANFEYRSMWNPAQALWSVHNAIVRWRRRHQ